MTNKKETGDGTSSPKQRPSVPRWLFLSLMLWIPQIVPALALVVNAFGGFVTGPGVLKFTACFMLIVGLYSTLVACALWSIGQEREKEQKILDQKIGQYEKERIDLLNSFEFARTRKVYKDFWDEWLAIMESRGFWGESLESYRIPGDQSAFFRKMPNPSFGEASLFLIIIDQAGQARVYPDLGPRVNSRFHVGREIWTWSKENASYADGSFYIKTPTTKLLLERSSKAYHEGTSLLLTSSPLVALTHCFEAERQRLVRKNAVINPPS